MPDQEEPTNPSARRNWKPRTPRHTGDRHNGLSTRGIHPRGRSADARPIACCVDGPGTQIAKLVTQAKRIREINEVFLEILPVSLTGHATIGRLTRSEWFVYTDSPVWATRLRYGLARLRRQFSDRLKMRVPALRIRVAPRNAPLPTPPRRRMIISDNSASLIEGTARSIRDARLKAALLRLATRARTGQ